MMVGERETRRGRRGKGGVAAGEGPPRLSVKGFGVRADGALAAVKDLSLDVRPGEIVGVAGVSGNGQKELVEALAGQRPHVGGTITIGGRPFAATRGEIRYWKSFSLPEEPLRNACVPGMSVAENMALRNFDRAPLAAGFWLKRGAMPEQAVRWIGQFRLQNRGPGTPICPLSRCTLRRTMLIP